MNQYHHGILICIILTLMSCARYPIPDSRISVEPWVQRKVEFQSPDIRSIKGDFIEIQIKGLNTTSNRLTLQYRTAFTDNQGYEIESIMNRWNDLEVAERQAFTIQAVSPSPQAQDFTIYIRKVK